MLNSILSALGLDLGDVLSKLESFKPVEDRSTAQGSLLPTLNAILAAWMTDVFPPLTAEVDNLIAKLRSHEDPIWQAVPAEFREVVRTQVSGLLKAVLIQKQNVQTQLKELQANAQGQNGGEAVQQAAK